MKKLIRALANAFAPRPRYRFVGRCQTNDTQPYGAFTYRMPAGFPGVVNRSHPMSIEPAAMDPDAPVLGYGRAMVPSSANPGFMRTVVAGDAGLTKIYGIAVRPYPIQQTSGTLDTPFGSATPPVAQPIDILTSGYIMVPVFGNPVKGDPVYVRIAASIVGQPQGGFESVTDPGNNVLLADTLGNIEFNGPPDANGVGEVRFRI